MFLLLFGLHLASCDPVVYAPWGVIRGTYNVTQDFSAYHAFKGIPYALPPVGDLRFSKPQIHPGFNHTFVADRHGPSCIQSLRMLGYSTVLGEEDCLTLNVFTPASHTETSGIPVMVWIHGGGFLFGDAWSFDPSPLVARGVIFVTIQYRLGAFGFLSTGDSTSMGNYGLWDQHLAIQWVKTNIHAFGGDINKITIIGESAGSSSVAYQALYPGSRGLFQKIITQSGSSTSTWAHKRNPSQYNDVLSKKVNCPPSNDAAMVACLRKVPARVLAGVSWPSGPDSLSMLADSNFVPTVDGEFVMDDPLLLINNLTYLKEVGFQDLDCMVSDVSNEGGGIFLISQNADKAYNTSGLAAKMRQTSFFLHKVIPYYLNLYYGETNMAMARAVLSVFVPSHPAPNHIDDQVAMSMNGDLSFNVPTMLFARAHSRVTSNTHSGKKTFMYIFDHQLSFMPKYANGTIHGTDVLFMFGLPKAMITPYSPNYTAATASEVILSNTLMDILTEFARNGDPNNAVQPFPPSGWPNFNTKNESYLHLGTHLSVKTHPFQKRMQLWTQRLPAMIRHHHHSAHAHTTPRRHVVIG